MTPTVSVAMLAYGEEEYLGNAVAAVLASTGVEVDLIVVDNGCTTDAVKSLPPDPRLRVITPAENLGFAGGVNEGLRHATGQFVATVNSDAIVEPDCLALLAAEAAKETVGVAGAVILLADRPDTLNSASNPLHVLGLSWSGHLDEPATTAHTAAAEMGVSGACLALRREVWDLIGGFPQDFFAYQEDMALCFTARIAGLDVRLVPQARVAHHYEFARNSLKMYLLERNRLFLVLTHYQARTIAVLALPLAAFEIAMGLGSMVQGWGREKRKGWGWLLRHQREVKDLRRKVQALRTVPDRALTPLWRVRFDSAQMPLPAAAAPLEWLLSAWWYLGRKLL